MKKLSVLLIIFFLVIPTDVFAHMPGQAPFLKINGELAKTYTVLSSSLPDFDLPQDLPSDNYLINQEITFEIDTSKLQVPLVIVRKTKFHWTFGDGESADGLSTNHIYKKIGSFIAKLTADDGTTPTPQLLESVLLDILPNKDYKIPHAVILVNGNQSKDPLVDILNFSFSKPIQFDATSSKAESSKIVSYFWDFGDGDSSIKSNEEHSYAQNLQIVFPALRIKDANGFISDTFVQVDNDVYNANKPVTKTKVITKAVNTNKISNQSHYIFIGLTLLTVMTVFMFIFSKRRSRKSSN